MASSGQCAFCSALAKTWCARCPDGLDSTLSPCKTYYCDMECQAANFETHKPLCRAANARKELKRGAELVQEIYYAFREIVFDTKPKQIKAVDGKLHIHLDVFLDKPAGPTEWPLYSFPKSAISNDKDKKALLVWNSCEDSIAYMHKLLREVLKGRTNDRTCCSPKEQLVVFKDEHKFIVRHFPDGSVDNFRFQHIVLNVGLKGCGDEHFIIDLAGAQYRQYQAIMPHQEFADKWTMCARETQYFGYWNRRWKNAVKYQNDPALKGSDMRVMILHDEVVRGINKNVGFWEKNNGTTLSEMLKQKQDSFEREKASLVKAIACDIRGHVNHIRSQPLLFVMEKAKGEDRLKWKDEQASHTLSFGPDVPQDIRDLLEDEMRRGTAIIDMSDL